MRAPTPPATPFSRRRTEFLLALGGAALAIGIGVYAADRDLSRSAWIPLALATSTRGVFGAVGGWLPDLVHPFAFSLWTAAILPVGRRPAYAACVAWALVDAGFELGQHPVLRPAFATLDGAMPSLLDRYFRFGRFDAADVLAILAGAASAAAVLRIVHPPRSASR